MAKKNEEIDIDEEIKRISRKTNVDILKSGRTFDNRIKNLEKEFPDLITEDSMSQKVGGHVKEGFLQVTHEVPLQSLQDVFSIEELEEFDKRVKKQLTYF